MTRQKEALPQWSFTGIQPHQDANEEQPNIVPDSLFRPIETTTSAHIKAKKYFLHPIDPHLIALCPVLDLVAVVTGERQVDCFRFDGHRAFSDKRVAKATVTNIAWTHHVSQSAVAGDSVHLCVSWDDGRIDFLTSAGERRVDINLSNLIDCPGGNNAAKSSGSINYITSSKQSIQTRKRLSRQHRPKFHSTKPAIDNTSASGNYRHSQENPEFFLEESDHTIGNLPAQLSALNILEELPPLGALTLGAPDPRSNRSESSPFTSQAAVDKLLNDQCSVLGRPLNLLLRGLERGIVECSIDDSVSAGQHVLTSPEPEEIKRVIRHGAHLSSSCHAFLLSKDDERGPAKSLSLSLISFSALRTPTNALPQIIESSRLLVSHAQYISQTILDVRQAYQTMHRLPRRLIENITETLQEKASGPSQRLGAGLSLPAALYRLAVAGNCELEVREWLVDQIGPQQHKRWDTAIDSGYRTIQELVLGCLIPAIDRVAVITSRLRVLSKMQPRYLEVDNTQFIDLLDRLNGLRLLAHTALKYARDELAQFRVFSPWLLLQIQGQAAESGSATAVELSEKAGAVDYSQLLPYITGAMTSDLLDALIGRPAVAQSEMEGTNSSTTTASLQDLLESYTAGTATCNSELDFLSHSGNLLQKARVITSNLAMSLQSDVSILRGLPITDDSTGIEDVRVLFDEQTKLITTYVLTVPWNTVNTVAIHHMTHREAPEQNEDPNQTEWISSYTREDLRYDDELGFEVIDLKIIDDEYCIVLLQCPDESRIMRLAYTMQSTDEGGPEPVPAPSGPINPLIEITSPSGTKSLLAQVGPPIMISGPVPIDHEDRAQTLTEYYHPEGMIQFKPARLYIDNAEPVKKVLVLNEEGNSYEVMGI